MKIKATDWNLLKEDMIICIRVIQATACKPSYGTAEAGGAPVSKPEWLCEILSQEKEKLSGRALSCSEKQETAMIR